MSRTTAIHCNDAEIFAGARLALDSEPTVPGTVRVHVDDGVATLTGIVRRPSERTAAEQVVRHVDGVRRVIDLVTVWQKGCPEELEGPDR